MDEAGAIGEPVILPQEGLARFATGAVRGTDADGERWDLITPIALRRLAETCAEGPANTEKPTGKKASRPA